MENGNLTSGSVIQCVKVITVNSSHFMTIIIYLCIQGVAICKHPFLNTSMGSSLHILNYTDLELVVVGTTVSFNCSKANEVLIGPNTATCMDNGRWEPDPSQLQNLTSCKGNAWYCYYQYRG